MSRLLLGIFIGFTIALALSSSAERPDGARTPSAWDRLEPARPRLRLELGAGVAQSRLAPEGSWWYAGFATHTELRTRAFSVGGSWLPLARGPYRLGLRAGYSDLGTVKASNEFPIFEDGSSRDARVNPTCDRATLAGCTGKFQGRGPTKGWSFGPVIERDFRGVTLGAEAGVFYYRAKWVATEFRAVDEHGEFVPGNFANLRWDELNKPHATWYIGATARWKLFFVQARRYALVHAADTERGKDFIGMTSGPLWSLMAGVAIAL